MHHTHGCRADVSVKPCPTTRGVVNDALHLCCLASTRRASVASIPSNLNRKSGANFPIKFANLQVIYARTRNYSIQCRHYAASKNVAKWPYKTVGTYVTASVSEPRNSWVYDCVAKKIYLSFHWENAPTSTRTDAFFLITVRQISPSDYKPLIAIAFTACHLKAAAVTTDEEHKNQTAASVGTLCVCNKKCEWSVSKCVGAHSANGVYRGKIIMKTNNQIIPDYYAADVWMAVCEASSTAAAKISKWKHYAATLSQTLNIFNMHVQNIICVHRQVTETRLKINLNVRQSW